MKRTKQAIAAGIGMGVLAAGIAMIPVSKDAGAAILVHDAQNIEEAIKTAIQTASILDNNQKQLALKILNSKKLDADILTDFLKSEQAAANQIQGPLSDDAKAPSVLISQGKSAGMLNKHTTPDAVLQTGIGSITDIFTGRSDDSDPYKMSQRNTRALEATYTNAATAAQSSLSAGNMITGSVQEALEASNHAEGTLQVQQSAVAIAAANAQATHNGNVLLAHMLAAQVEEAYVKNYERAVTAKLEQDSRESFHEFMK